MDETMLQVETVVGLTAELRNSAGYRECLLLKASSEGSRNNQKQFAKELETYANSSFPKPRKGMAKLHLEVAWHCYKWELHGEGLRHVSEFNTIPMSQEEVNAIKQLHSDGYFEDMLMKDNSLADFPKSKQLLKFIETLQLKVPVLEEGLVAMVEQHYREEKEEELKELKVDATELSTLMDYEQRRGLVAVVRLVCAEEDLDRIREKWNWMLRVGDQHIESSTMKAKRRLKLMQPSVEEYNRSIYMFCR